MASKIYEDGSDISMASEASRLRDQSWSKGTHLISTDPSLIPIDKVNKAFASNDVYWATPLPDEIMREALYNGICFGLYNRSQSNECVLEFLGLARCITDFTTFLYLTDVYVDTACQGQGLGAWLVSCIKETIDSMPYLRRSLLFTGDWKRSVPFYEKLLGMDVMENKKGEGIAVMERKGKGHPDVVSGKVSL